MKILRVFDNIKLPIKMGLIGLLALAGLAFPTYYYTQISVDGQSSSEIELRGIVPTSNMVMLKKVLAEHRGMSSAMLAGDSSKSGAVSAKANEVDQTFSKLASILSEASSDDGLSNQLRDIKNAWEQVKGRVAARSINAADSSSTHSGIMQKADLLISEMSKYFLLSYDPAAASYHAIIANFQNLPRLANSLGKIRGAGAAALASSEITAVQQASIRGFLNNLESPLQDLSYNMTSAADADARFNNVARNATNLSQLVASLSATAEREILNSSTSTYSSSEFFNEYTSAINQLFDMHNSSIGILTTVIQERIDNAAAERVKTLTLLAVTILIAALLLF